jgi:hypothetical protein
VNSPFNPPKTATSGGEARDREIWQPSCKASKEHTIKTIILGVSLLLAATVSGRAESVSDPYPAAYAASLRDRLPLLVFVGQPAREMSGARAISVTTCPNATAPCVVVGVVRDGEMYRKDVPGAPATQEIQSAIAGLSAPESASADALDEVNAVRAARGLRPFARDDNLRRAAAGCAEFRAARLMAGHTANDFAALPAGTSASAAGCAAWEQGMGWGACCTYENYTYAGAAYAMGRDGRRYMHLFVR